MNADELYARVAQGMMPLAEFEAELAALAAQEAPASKPWSITGMVNVAAQEPQGQGKDDPNPVVSPAAATPIPLEPVAPSRDAILAMWQAAFLHSDDSEGQALLFADQLHKFYAQPPSLGQRDSGDER